MKLTELVGEIAVRCGGLSDPAKADAFLADLRKCGVQDGPAVQDAFDMWRVRWDKRYAPMASQFAEFYTSPNLHYTEEPTRAPDGQAWAKTVLLGYPEGREAVERNIAWDLAVFCRGNPGKLPSLEDMDEWVACRNRYARGDHGVTGIWAKTLAGIWQNIQRKEADIQRWARANRQDIAA